MVRIVRVLAYQAISASIRGTKACQGSLILTIKTATNNCQNNSCDRLQDTLPVGTFIAFAHFHNLGRRASLTKVGGAAVLTLPCPVYIVRALEILGVLAFERSAARWPTSMPSSPRLVLRLVLAAN